MVVKKAVKIPDKILKILEGNPSMSLKEVADNIGKSLRVVERACAELKKQGALIRVGTPRGGHWQVTVKNDGINDGKTKS